MFCPECGTELKQNAKFYANCGNKLSDEAIKQPEATAPAVKPKWKKVVTWVFLCIVGIIALATLTTSGLMDPVEAISRHCAREISILLTNKPRQISGRIPP